MTEEELKEFKDLVEDLQIECKCFKGLLLRFEKTIDLIHPSSKALKFLKSLEKNSKNP